MSSKITFDATAEYAATIKDAETATALVATIRAAVNGVGKYAAYVESNDVDRDNVKDHARALAMLAYPNEKTVQKVDGKRTKFGNAVQAAGNGLRAVLNKDSDDEDTTTPDYLALAVQAARTAHDKGEISTDDILTAVTAALVTGK